MNPHRWKLPLAACSLLALFAPLMAGAQERQPSLKITPPISSEMTARSDRQGASTNLDRAAAFRRIYRDHGLVAQSNQNRRSRSNVERSSKLEGERLWAARLGQGVSAPRLQSFGTGGGDIDEIEPNDRIAQGVSLPVNVFGDIEVDGDVDFFAFQALAGQQITIEPFAARLQNSDLVADLALFDSSGRLLARDVGDAEDDPLIRYVSGHDEVLIAGIADIDDFGGSSYRYLLNITRGVDVEEEEPNGRVAQSLPALPVTIFGDVNGSSDVDFYSFVAEAGQTLIVDVDAEVLGSPLDPEVNLLDPSSGVEFFYNDQHDRDDSRFNIVLPYTGRYVIGIDAFRGGSNGFYRLNVSLVPGDGAPLITHLTRLSKKVLEVSGASFTVGAVVEVNGDRVRTTPISSGTLRAKAKVRAGDVVTVANSPDERRSNPLIFQ